MAVENLAYTSDNLAAFYKGITYFRINNQVNIALTVTGFNVLQSMPFFRQRTQGFGQHFYGICFNRQLAHMGAESSTGNTYSITDIHQLNQRIVFFADNVFTYIYLDTAGLILHIHEAGFAVAADSHNTASHFYFSFFFGQLIELRSNICCTMGVQEAIAERFPAMLLNFMHLVNADLHLLVDFVFGKHCSFFCIRFILYLCHCRPSPYHLISTIS